MGHHRSPARAVERECRPRLRARPLRLLRRLTIGSFGHDGVAEGEGGDAAAASAHERRWRNGGRTSTRASMS